MTKESLYPEGLSADERQAVKLIGGQVLGIPAGAMLGLSRGQVGGRKDDSGKLDMTLLDDMPLAVKALVQVMQWAIVDKKPVPYERGSWQGVEADRYRAAIMRHGRDAAEQAKALSTPTFRAEARFERDHETGLLHLAHQACSAMMALENVLQELERQRVGK